MTTQELAAKVGARVCFDVDSPKVLVVRGRWSREYPNVHVARWELLQMWADKLMADSCRTQAQARRALAAR